ncbi:lactate utilization protein [Chloroflexota bacterium]
MKEDIIVEQEEKAIYEKLANTAVKNFTRRNINAQYASNKEEALSMVMDMIPEGATVGTADSVTLLQVGVFSALKKRGRNEIINPFVKDEEGYFVVEEEERLNLMRRVFFSDVYVIGTNAVTLDGKLVNTDGNGNRVAAMMFGPKKVIIVIGANKIVKNADEGLKRIREVCAPVNATRHAIKHQRPQYLELPCVKTGICTDCNHPWRICHHTTIIEGVAERRRGHINVVLVGERLGI